jgi:hypothetical protein
LSDAQFFTTALPYARRAHTATGALTSVILAQWADETAYGGPDWSVDHNPGNVGSFTGRPVNSFPTLTAGVAAYIQTMLDPDYAAVRSAVGYVAQSIALGESPWAASHYDDGNGPGSILITIVQSFDLTQYDQPAPPPPPPPLPKGVSIVGVCIAPTGRIVVDGVTTNGHKHVFLGPDPVAGSGGQHVVAQGSWTDLDLSDQLGSEESPGNPVLFSS